MRNDKIELCPLTLAMVSLLQTAAYTGLTNDRELADLLIVTPDTIHTTFGRVCARLGVHDRAAALLVAVEYGWVTLPKTTGQWRRPEPDE